MKPFSASRLVITLYLSFVSIQSYADQWYHVELIIFEQLDTITDEQWPVMPEEVLIGSLTPDMANAFIQPASNENLNKIATRLDNSSQYRVDYHQSWQQFIMKKGQAKTINITHDDSLVVGTIRLDKATYLHAVLDLWLNQNKDLVPLDSDVTPQGTDISAPRNPHLEESRRIRSNKLYFFDHPKIGALLTLTPIATPDAVQTDLELLETFSLPNEGVSTASE